MNKLGCNAKHTKQIHANTQINKYTRKYKHKHTTNTIQTHANGNNHANTNKHTIKQTHETRIKLGCNTKHTKQKSSENS